MGQKKDTGVGEIKRVRVPKPSEFVGEVEIMLGNRRMNVRCNDGRTRLCRIPGKIRKRLRIKEGDLLLIEPWEIEKDAKGDILWRYSPQDAEWLSRRGFLNGIV